MLFTREDSRQAARTFLRWLRSKQGRCTKSEMSTFSHELAAGKRGARFSRTNFYAGILARFMDLGLVAEDMVYDPEARKGVKAYHVVVQPVSGRRPTSPSLLFLAHVVSEHWNQEIFESSAT